MKQPNAPRRAFVIFDLDGTLIDSLPDIAAATNRLLASEGRPPLSHDEVKPMIGDGAGTLVERAFAPSGGLPGPSVAPSLARFLEEYEPRAAEATKPFPGVIATLTRLREMGYRLAVCTNKPSEATRGVLNAFGMTALFDVVVGGDETPALKPDARHVTTVLDRLGATAAEAAYVGDSINDVTASHAAGLPCILVSFGYTRIPVHELGAEIVIDHFEDLPAALADL
jgi:phosphoglycolate phosphatase